MPPTKGETPTKDDLKAAYDEGYAAAMAEPLDPGEPALQQLAEAAYQKGYAEGAEAARPPVPPFEQAKAFVRTQTHVDGARIGQALDEWQTETGVKLNSSDVNLLKTMHDRLRSRRHAREDAERERRPPYSTTREEPGPIETEYEAVT